MGVSFKSIVGIFMGRKKAIFYSIDFAYKLQVLGGHSFRLELSI
jgi:hypothetical protein